ncbi:MAG: GBS Bsp-like repeat-containing protein [Lactobacillales bacterium]|jgi:hypothetical protein|nr:GBS Bsp-like repeat-containing protein [Lactobacillales bacterium]
MKKKLASYLLVGSVLLNNMTALAIENSETETSQEVVTKEDDAKSEVGKMIANPAIESNDIETSADEEIPESVPAEESTNIPMGFYASGKSISVKATKEAITKMYEAPTGRAAMLRSLEPSTIYSDDPSLPNHDFIDIASYQYWLTANDYKVLKNSGVKGVVVKLTEGTTYQNPYAQEQISRARAAGLQVAVYHYSTFNSESSARNEAKYFADFANQLGLPKNTVMVNDAEDPKMSPLTVDATQTSLAFKTRLNELGFNTVKHYCSVSWIGDYTASMEPRFLGAKNIWAAQYLYGKPSKDNLQNTAYASWQFSSSYIHRGLSRGEFIDTNVDYGGMFGSAAGDMTPPTISKEESGVVNLNPTLGTFSVNVKAAATLGISSVNILVRHSSESSWKTYKATSQGNDIYKAAISVENHGFKNGTYFVRANAIGQNGQQTEIEISNSVVVNLTPISASTKIETQNGYSVKTTISSQGGYKIKSIYHAIWSDKNGQDDLIWYPASKNGNVWQTTVDLSKHKTSGRYTVHTYAELTDGSKIGLGADYFDVEMNEPKINGEIKNINKANGTFDVIIKPQNSIPLKKVEVPVWSSKNGQDDIKWYSAIKQTDGTYKVTVDIKNHKHIGVFNVHAYATSTDGIQAGIVVGTASLTIAGKTTVNGSSATGSSFVSTTNISQLNSKISRIYHAVWSEKDGQDDLVWYVANPSGANYETTTDIRRHKTAGIYNIHTYAQLADGEMVFVDAKTINIEGPKINAEIKNINRVDGTFDVIVKPQNKVALDKVEVPVWSNRNGQDDIKWYRATKQSDGTYKVTVNLDNHKSVGDYSVHVYAYSSSGLQSGISIGTINMNIAGKTTNNDAEKSDMKVTAKTDVHQLNKKVTKIYHAVWSEQGGQDDIVWYVSEKNGNSYQSNVEIKRHKTAGVYNNHTYALTSDGEMVFLNSSTFTIDAPKFTPEVKSIDKSNGSFDVIVKPTQVKSGVERVSVPVWSERNQSNIKWYDAVKQSDGTYKASVTIKNHQNKLAVYHVHAYLYGKNGISTAINAGDVNLVPKITGKTTVTNNGNMYKLSTKVDGETNFITDVYYPTWGNVNGQNDIVWYKATKLSNGTYELNFDIIKHQETGLFTTHTYAQLKDGSMKALDASSFSFPPKK